MVGTTIRRDRGLYDSRYMTLPPNPVQGDVLYYDGANWVVLGAGAVGDFLQTAGVGANPAWATVITTYVRSKTLIVAASNSLDTTNADYVCDGVADEVQINQAINDLPATGGSVCLMDGTYTLAGSINLNVANSSIIGQGRNTRILSTDIARKIINCTVSYCTIERLKIEGLNTAGCYGVYFRVVYGVVINCMIKTCYYGVYIYDRWHIVTNNLFYGAGTYGIYQRISAGYDVITGNTFKDTWGYPIYAVHGECEVSGNAILSGGIKGIYIGQRSVVTGNYIQNASRGIEAAGINITITGNTIYGGSYAIWSPYNNNTITGNAMKDVGTAVYQTGEYCSIIGNTIENSTGNYAAIYLISANWCSVVGNTMQKIDREGIELDTSNHNIISENNIHDCSEDANDTYSGILLTDTSTYNIVSNNRVSADAANKHKYGIREAAVADDWNLLHGNILTDAVTANLSSQGANSVSADNIAP